MKNLIFLRLLNQHYEKNKFELQNGDVLVISSKYVSNSQGRLIQFR